MRATIESDWLRQNLHRWKGAITIAHQTVFEGGQSVRDEANRIKARRAWQEDRRTADRLWSLTGRAPTSMSRVMSGRSTRTRPDDYVCLCPGMEWPGFALSAGTRSQYRESTSALDALRALGSACALEWVRRPWTACVWAATSRFDHLAHRPGLRRDPVLRLSDPHGRVGPAGHRNRSVARATRARLAPGQRGKPVPGRRFHRVREFQSGRLDRRSDERDGLRGPGFGREGPGRSPFDRKRPIRGGRFPHSLGQCQG